MGNSSSENNDQEHHLPEKKFCEIEVCQTLEEPDFEVNKADESFMRKIEKKKGQNQPHQPGNRINENKENNPVYLLHNCKGKIRKSKEEENPQSKSFTIEKENLAFKKIMKKEKHDKMKVRSITVEDCPAQNNSFEKPARFQTQDAELEIVEDFN